VASRKYSPESNHCSRQQHSSIFFWGGFIVLFFGRKKAELIVEKTLWVLVRVQEETGKVTIFGVGRNFNSGEC
jgi:hypothetical protein